MHGGLTARRIESLLSARLFVQPQLARGRLFFISNLSGHLSLYAMSVEGGVPEPLLGVPTRAVLTNRHFHPGNAGDFRSEGLKTGDRQIRDAIVQNDDEKLHRRPTAVPQGIP